MTEDYPAEIAARRKRLFPILDAAYHYRDAAKPELRYKGQVVGDKLIINGSVYGVDTLHRLPNHLQPQNVATPRNDTTVLFFTRESPLSNHYPCTFTTDGDTFNCMEQYIMKTKALHFGDTDTAAKVMAEKEPGYQKELGKKVAGFDLKRWREEVPKMLKTGLTAKFSQNQSCKDFLKDTGNRTIGEANPRDSFYGIAKAISDRDAWDTAKWAHNWLGKTLMEIREELSQ